MCDPRPVGNHDHDGDAADQYGHIDEHGNRNANRHGHPYGDATHINHHCDADGHAD